MLRFAVVGIALVVVATAAMTGFLAYREFSEEDQELIVHVGTAWRSWDIVPDDEREDICSDFAREPEGGDDLLNHEKYEACMQCGPEGADYLETQGWHCEWPRVPD